MAREIKTGEIVALKKIRMDNEREGVCSCLGFKFFFVLTKTIKRMSPIGSSFMASCFLIFGLALTKFVGSLFGVCEEVQNDYK